MEPDTSVDATRARRLKGRFLDVINGKSKITISRDAQIFIEAICVQSPPDRCVETILASPHGLEAIRHSVRVDLSLPFIKNHSISLLTFLSHPTIKSLAGGHLLGQIIDAIISPSTFWQSLVNACLGSSLEEQNLLPVAWLIHEVTTRSEPVDQAFLTNVHEILEHGLLSETKVHETRELMYKIEKAMKLRLNTTKNTDSKYSPGGRHDNDCAHIRNIKIYPTLDELKSKETPFYRTLTDVIANANDEDLPADVDTVAAAHIDNQFRLLREDMLGELRKDLQVAVSGKRDAKILKNLQLEDIIPAGEDRSRSCSLAVICLGDLHDLRKMDKVEQRKKFLTENPRYLGHQSFGVLLSGCEVSAFAFIHRDLESLSRMPPVVHLQFVDPESLQQALLLFKVSADINFALVDTAMFSYEPVLKVLQNMVTIPLAHRIMRPGDIEAAEKTECDDLIEHAYYLRRRSLRMEDGGIELDSGARLDKSQLKSLLRILEEDVSIIQGPPGTGKTFIGTQAIKTIYKQSNLRVLIISYTNHALDQALENLVDIGIPQSAMIRLGSKSTARTSPMLLKNQDRKVTGKYERGHWARVDAIKQEKSELVYNLRAAMSQYREFSPDLRAIQEYLEFEYSLSAFYEAFTVPTDIASDWRQVGKKNKEVGPDYLFKRWKKGDGPGVFHHQVPPHCEFVWDMEPTLRREHHARWTEKLVHERAQHVQELAGRLDRLQEELDTLFSRGKIDALSSVRIIGCTSTAAASHMKLLRAFSPDVMLVEEAGEILESHVLTSMAPNLKRFIQIGDYKQLRPKIQNYALSVEKGDGFNLNMSMFERLILQGHPYVALQKQHRMHPDLSLFPRALTYPELLDGPKTSDRASIEGLRDRVIFISHEHLEGEDGKLMDRADAAAKSSKSNKFEAAMVLKMVRYLAQQGIGTDRMVVVTPYLGQVRLLHNRLSSENDPILNDLDSAELLQSGIVVSPVARMTKRPLRISSIDNYQGEESDIVIASMTRGNLHGDIGFMSAPERLNVLITRARCALIMIGNMNTFTKSKKGASTWLPYFELLNKNGHIYDGLPVVCARHPDAKADLQCPEDFATFCPDGGCAQPCNAMFSCGLHTCKLRCHRLDDHSLAPCQELLVTTCVRQHKYRVRCGKSNEPCKQCRREDEETERRVKRDLKLEKDRLERQSAYREQLQKIQDEVQHEKRLLEIMAEDEKDLQEIEQEKQALRAHKRAVEQKQKAKSQEDQRKAAKTARANASPAAQSNDENRFPSKARDDWEDLKKVELAESEPLDELMDMIGLEKVKEEFLAIKATVDTKIRQNVALGSQRYGASLLGNPGTGKTTVARLYAKFLSSIGAIAGSKFKETTGAKLANIGVSGCEKLVQEVLDSGGGVIFIDEAYQLTSGNNYGGGAVLDYFLAEVENLSGKVVFVLAGYDKQMESFFAHNPGLPSRFPFEMRFADYSDLELLHILGAKIDKQFSGNMRCEEGLQGLYCRIVVRRIGRGRGKDGFGNARTVENVLQKISQRQAVRLSRLRRQGVKDDDLLLTKEDLIGPRPAEALKGSSGWRDLQKLSGLQLVKDAVGSLVDSIESNYQRELEEQPLIEYSLNKVFIGNPGTGKTTVAKLYGQVLVDLGLLSKGEVVVKNPSDFVGSVLGQSESNTKGILAAAMGKVLVIDEAYGLYGGHGSTADHFKTAVIDTIVAEVQSVPGDDRCVLLLGYKDQMEDMFQNVNPGLSRRFPMASAFVFEDFSDAELQVILDLKLKQQGFQATDQAKQVAMEMLGRARNRPNFGNAGEIDIILDATKARHQVRLSRGQCTSGVKLEALDFDENFDRAARTETNVKKLFEGTVGCEDIVEKLEGYQSTVRTMKALDMDPKENIPFNFLFRGPPGTGKTTTARKMGKVFYDMGFLSTAEVVECSATDLIGQYIGQTGPKVLKQLEKALGKVLFVDEAYRLGEGHFSKEAMDEIVDAVTKPKYHKKMVIILAGYVDDINRLMATNTGLNSRFPETIDFRSLTPDECIRLLHNLLADKGKRLEAKSITFDMSEVQDLIADTTKSSPIHSFFRTLVQQESWANARDVQSIAKGVFVRVTSNASAVAAKSLRVEKADLVKELETMLNERSKRAEAGTPKAFTRLHRKFYSDAPIPGHHPAVSSPEAAATTAVTAATSADIRSNTDTEPAQSSTPEPWRTASEEAPSVVTGPVCREPSAPLEVPPHLRGIFNAKRDDGVSDEVWEQLERDKHAELQREMDHQKLVQNVQALKDRKASKDEIVKRLIKLEEEEEKRRKEAALKAKIAQLGRCPVGYDWIKQAGGYRCAGGSHFLADF